MKLSTKFLLMMTLILTASGAAMVLAILQVHSEATKVQIQRALLALNQEQNASREQLTDSMQSKNDMVGRFLAQVAPLFIESFDFDALKRFKNVAEGDQDIRSVDFLDDMGRPIDPTVELAKVEKGEKNSFAIGIEGKLVGTVRLHTSKERLELALLKSNVRIREAIANLVEASKNTNRNFLSLIIVVVLAEILLLGFFFFVGFRALVGSPIVETVRATEQISEGDYSVSLLPVRNDEIGILQASLDAMRLRIRDFTHDLQGMVEDRTLELAESNQKLEGQNMQSNLMLRVLSHDIINAVTIIKGSVSVLESSCMQSKGRSHGLTGPLASIIRAVNTQEEILSNVRKLISLSDGKTELVLLPVDLNGLESDVNFFFGQKLEEKNLTLKFENQLDQNEGILGDQFIFTNNILNNVVSNAIKFSLDGGSVRIAMEEGEDGSVLVSVADNGIGMPDTIKENIFAIDKPTTRTGTKGERGTGFGMPIVKSFVESFEGSVWVESRSIEVSPDDHGTTFHMTFKKAKLQQSEQPESNLTSLALTS